MSEPAEILETTTTFKELEAQFLKELASANAATVHNLSFGAEKPVACLIRPSRNGVCNGYTFVDRIGYTIAQVIEGKLHSLSQLVEGDRCGWLVEPVLNNSPAGYSFTIELAQLSTNPFSLADQTIVN